MEQRRVSHSVISSNVNTFLCFLSSFNSSERSSCVNENSKSVNFQICKMESVCMRRWVYKWEHSRESRAQEIVIFL